MMAAAGKLQQLSVLTGRSEYEDWSCQRGQLYEMAVVGDRGLRTVMPWVVAKVTGQAKAK
jgi:hypothetical protein